MYSPYRPLTEPEEYLRILSKMQNTVSDKNRFWATVKKEISHFDNYCQSTYSQFQTNLFNIIIRFTSNQPDLDSIEHDSDSTRDNIIKFNDTIGAKFLFYVRLKYKYDKKCGKSSKASKFADKLLKKYKFCNIGMGDFICMLSDIYFTLNELKRAREALLKGGSSSTWVPPSAFVRSTRKYWVRLEDLTKLKLHICKHLPLLRFGRKQGITLPANASGSSYVGNRDYSQFDNAYNGDGEGDSSKITSVYFDNDKLRLYHDKIVRKEGATLIRIRWYGEEGRTCFMERKTWHDSWVLNDSIKERFDLKWPDVPGYLSGNFLASDFVQKLSENPKYDRQTLREILGLAQSVQDRILKLQLHPAVRTTYNRTAFQHSDNNSIRISIDTSLELSREPRDPGPGRWCRDISKGIPDEDKFVFPMAVLEIKLHSINDTPQWIQDIVNSDYVVSAYKFSKFMHGTAKLNGVKAKVLPSWFNRTCTHIPGHPLKHWFRQSTHLIPNKMDFDGVLEWESLQPREIAQYRLEKTNFFDGKESDWSSEEEEESDEPIEPLDDKLIKLSLLKKKKPVKSRLPRDTRIMRMDGMVDDQEMAFNEVSSTNQVILKGSVSKGGPEILSVFHMKKKPKWAGITPVLQAIRFEPKTNLALERTFLNWQRTFIFLASVALFILIVAPYPYEILITTVFVFGLIVSSYALGVFHVRRKAIRVRSVDGHYDDKWGPTIVAGMIFITLLIMFIWQFKLTYLIPYVNPDAKPFTRSYSVPISISFFSNGTTEEVLSQLNTNLIKFLPSFSISGSLSEVLGMDTYAFWDTPTTCYLRNNGYYLRSFRGLDNFGQPTTNMALEYLTYDDQLIARMNIDFPYADYHNSEYFRPPDFLNYGREKTLPISPDIDVYTLLNVAQQFEPFYLWDFTNKNTWNEQISQVAGIEFDYYVYGGVQIDLGSPYVRDATLTANVWYQNSIPAFAELSLSIPVIPGYNLTTTEIRNARKIYSAMQKVSNMSDNSGVSIMDFVYGHGFCA